ncbi:hypothetical protein ACIRSS_31840 [Amycolatopsis sp. NPDC101161]|uniref:hypothetical protein n=1 Tax=Amycolatopsis sp. NPDC101161 TaxID=3363940 RepID=UPI0037F13BA3
MSKRSRVFLVVEGKNHDQWYYEALCNKSPDLKQAGVTAYTASSIGRELGENLQGKKGVLRVHDRLKELKSLSIGNGTRRKVIMCCVDADHDRTAGKMKRSKHLTYTQLPDVEAHILNDCSEKELLARTLSTTDTGASDAARDLGNWRKAYAVECKDWFVACHISAHLAIQGGPNPDTPPPLKQGKLDRQALSKLLQSIEKSSGAAAYTAARKVIEGRIDALITSRRYTRILKGKWLASHLARKLHEYAKKHGLDSSGNATSILACAKGMLDFQSSWATYFRARVRSVLTP